MGRRRRTGPTPLRTRRRNPSGGTVHIFTARVSSLGFQQVENGAAMFGEVPPYDRPPAVVEPLLPEVQRVPLVSHFPLMSPGRFWLEVPSPEKFFHRKILPERAAVCVEFYKDLEPHVGDRDDQVFRSTLAKRGQDGADVSPFDMFKRLAAEDRVIPGNFVGPQFADVLFKVGNIRVGE